jgi:putative oxidoreductase
MRLQALPATYGITVVRVMMGIILVVASLEKFTGGGLFGFVGVVTNLGIVVPQFFGVFIPSLELVGGLMILFGLGARWVAILFVCEFFTNAVILKTPRQPPFGGWDSMRIDLMLLAAAISIVLVGPGELALDGLLRRRTAASLEPQYR